MNNEKVLIENVLSKHDETILKKYFHSRKIEEFSFTEFNFKIRNKINKMIKLGSLAFERNRKFYTIFNLQN